MFDSFSNIIFIFILVAVFIGRTVAEARKKKAPPPPAPKVPALHFEEKEEDETLEYFKKIAAQGKIGHGAVAAPQAVKTAGKTRKKQASALPAQAVNSSYITGGDTGSYEASGSKSSPAKENVKPGVYTPGQREFTLNLNHLSPMKQAVVMAEILGQPRGLNPMG